MTATSSNNKIALTALRKKLARVLELKENENPAKNVASEYTRNITNNVRIIPLDKLRC
jgi:replication initiation and membrane attachment protein DnaB